MKRVIFLFCSLVFALWTHAQKKPLDHTVYDSWQRIGERIISNDGAWIVYTVEPQEGDNELFIQSVDGEYKQSIPRGYNAVITEDSRYLIFKIKPPFKETREARIKKKKQDDFPKDSLAIVELGKTGIWRTSRVKGYKTPQKGSGWVAYQLEKPMAPAAKAKTDDPNKRVTDSLNRMIDSLQALLKSAPVPKKKKNKDAEEEELFIDAEGDETGSGTTDTGTELILRNLQTGEAKTFPRVLEYYFSKDGGKLLIEQSADPKDSTRVATVLLYNVSAAKPITLSRGGNEFKNFAISDDGKQVSYVAERDARPKDLQKFYRVWYYKEGMDSATLLTDRFSVGMKLGMTISEFGNLGFSKSGKRLFFGTAPIQPPKDTTIVDIDMPKLDIWHYNDDYLQTVQTFPNRLRNDLQQNYLAVYDLANNSIKQLGSREMPFVNTTNEGDGETFIGVTDFGKRIESQWLGTTRKDIYAIDVATGEKKLIKSNLHGQAYESSTGKYILWYDREAKNYFVWDGKSTRNLTGKIKVPLWNEESEVPEAPNVYGVMKWEENDAAVYVYDRYDIWKIDPTGNQAPFLITNGRKDKIRYRYIQTDPEEQFLKSGTSFLVSVFDDKDKSSGLGHWNPSKGKGAVEIDFKERVQIGNILKAKNSPAIILTKETFEHSPDLYTNNSPGQVSSNGDPAHTSLKFDRQLTHINPQQVNYNWGTAELFKWKAYNGKESTGIVFKPENFDPKKKYPLICYFYEKLSDSLYDYKAPAPIRSAINVPFFVSRGYIIFYPDIHYGTGHPGRDAYNYVVSGTRALVKKGFIDSTRMAIQGHSWGGYQVAQIITQTKLYKAAWAGAPVANMTSAYGGIRWESGVNRQFQYEKTQSRIGATLWEKPQLYIENSPLFHLDKVTTPLVIMANDADGAVPWYQGIELFTAMRRLGKKVWMFNYNGQGHGLTQRQDMRDYQIRMQQFFDWILKGDKPAKWITEGLPAVKKGKDWALEVE